jgi:hypothetical protein
MLFPKKFITEIYDETLRIAADQDLKFRLYNQHVIQNLQTYGVSSLTGGISQNITSLEQVFERTAETSKILRRYFGTIESSTLSALFFIKFCFRLLSRGKIE